MRAIPALIMLCLTATGVTRAAGTYAPVPLEDDERHLIESAQELEAYFRDQSLLYGDEDVVALVRRVGAALAPAPVDDYVDYRFFVLRDPSPNAFALPNGHVYVHTGMLARLEDESQLAALLGHEITHVAGHHGILNQRTATKRTIAALVLGGLGGGWGSVISVGLQASVFGFSRDLEQEADDHAVMLLADGPYDPHALPEVLDILGRDYEGVYPRVPTIWSTHPEIRARAETSRALVQDLPRRARDPQAFDAVIFPLRLLTIRDYIQDDYPHTALALAESLAERYPDDARVQHVLGDAWAALGAQRRLDPEELSNADKRRNLRERARRTREQRLQELLETEEGRAAYVENLTRAAEVQDRALALDPDFAPAHRSLGEVYERLRHGRHARDRGVPRRHYASAQGRAAARARDGGEGQGHRDREPGGGEHGARPVAGRRGRRADAGGRLPGGGDRCRPRERGSAAAGVGGGRESPLRGALGPSAPEPHQAPTVQCGRRGARARRLPGRGRDRVHAAAGGGGHGRPHGGGAARGHRLDGRGERQPVARGRRYRRSRGLVREHLRRRASAKSIEENPQGEMAQLAASMLAKLPGADPTLRVEEAESDEDVLSDVESLLQE